MLKQGAKPVPQRRKRQSYEALDLVAFQQQPEEEKKEEKPDERMDNEDFIDVSHRMRQSKRNKTPANRD